MPNKFFTNSLYLALFFMASQAFADCTLNRYGQELCTGDQVLLIGPQIEGEAKEDQNYVPVQIKEINYNILIVKFNGANRNVRGEQLIGQRNCETYKSVFCEKKKVTIKEECQSGEKTFKSVQLFYNDLVLVKESGLFKNDKRVVKAECLKLDS